MQCRERKRECYENALVIINSLISQGNNSAAYKTAEVFLKLYIDEDIITKEEKTGLCRIYVDLYNKNPEKPAALKDKYLVVEAMSVILQSENSDKKYHEFANLLKDIFVDHVEEMFENLPLAQLVLKMSLKINASYAIKMKNEDSVSDALLSAEYLAIVHSVGEKKDKQAAVEISCLKIIAAYFFGFFKSDRKRAGKIAMDLAGCCEKNGNKKEWGSYCYYAILMLAEHMLKKGEELYDILGNACQNMGEYFAELNKLEKSISMYDYAILFYRHYSCENLEKAEKKLAYLLLRSGELYKFLGKKADALRLWNESLALAEKYKGDRLCDMISRYLKERL